MSSAHWKLIGIDHHHLFEVVPLVHEWLKDVETLTDGKLTYESLIEQLAKSEMQMWLVVGEKVVATIVTEVLTYPKKKYCHVLIVSGGGNAKDWHRPIIEQIETWAKNEGCDAVEMYGRKGWLRLLPDYKVKQYRMTKELS